MRVSCSPIRNRTSVKSEMLLRLSTDPGRSSVMSANEPSHFVNFAPTGINKWSRKREEGSPQRISILFRQARDTNRLFWPPGRAGVAQLSSILRRRGAPWKKSRRSLMDGSDGDMLHSVNDVRLVMFLQGSSVRILCRRSIRNGERSPSKRVAGSAGLPHIQNSEMIPMSNLSRRGAWRDS